MPTNHIGALLIFLILSGCSTSISLTSIEPEGEIEVANLETFKPNLKPEIATVGDHMITNGSSGFYSAQQLNLSAELLEELQIAVPHKLRVFHFNLAPNALKHAGKSSFGRHYEYPETFRTSKGRSAQGGLITSYNNSGTAPATHIYWKWTDSPAAEFYSAPISNKSLLKISSIPTEKIRGINQSATRVLIYTGVSDGKINFTYYEFARGGYLKPDFTQNVTLDYKPNTEYAFKTARFLVMEASVSQIKFKLIDDLK